MHETDILLHTSNRGKKGTREGKKGTMEGKKGAREGKKGAAPFYFGLAGTLYSVHVYSALKIGVQQNFAFFLEKEFMMQVATRVINEGPPRIVTKLEL